MICDICFRTATLKKDGLNLCWRHQLFPKRKEMLPVKIEIEDLEKLR